MNKACKYVFSLLFLCSSVICYGNDMALIPRTTFERWDSSGNKQTVTVSSFYIAEKTVTAEEWMDYLQKSEGLTVMWRTGITVSEWKHSIIRSLDDCSITTVDPEWPAWELSWLDAAKYCNWLSERENLKPCYEMDNDANSVFRVRWNKNADGYRLPTVAEWQLVSELYTKKPAAADLMKSNWLYENNIAKLPHKVGTLPPNTYGLYDIMGNIQEFCWDYYNKEYEYKETVIDPSGPSDFTPDYDEIFFKEPIHEKRVIAGAMWASIVNEAINHPLDSLVNIETDFVGIRLVRNAPK